MIGAELKVAAFNCSDETADAKTHRPVEPVSNRMLSTVLQIVVLGWHMVTLT